LQLHRRASRRRSSRCVRRVPATLTFHGRDEGDFYDALEWTFDSDQTYTALADGRALASLAIIGKLPVNEFSPGVGGPVIGSISQSTTGGSLPGGSTFRIALCAVDSNGLPSAP